MTSRVTRLARPMAAGLAVAGATFYGLNLHTQRIRLEAKYDVKTPGLYVWGSNVNRVVNASSQEANVRTPYRVPYFDGKVLRHVAMNEQTGLAVEENGDVVQWGGEFGPRVVLKGKDIRKVALSGNGVAFALNQAGQKVYSWNTLDSTFNGFGGSSWWKLWGTTEEPTLNVPEFRTFESIEDIRAGQEHVVALTNKGRVFSGPAGQISESKGQFGIAAFSHFESPPAGGKLYDVKLIRNLSSNVVQIASGDNHVLLRTQDGRLYGFGQNLYGQLATTFAQRTANVAVPTEIPLTRFVSPSSSYFRKVSNIAAGGAISYVTISGVDNDRDEYYSFGNGLSGQLGTGSFSHAQVSPLKLKWFDDLSEYSESLKKMIPIPITDWAVGRTHTAVTLGTGATTDLLVWGGNQSSQLGTGKKNTVSRPINIPPLDNSRDEPSDMGLVRLQLFKNHALKFKTPNGKNRSLTVNQMFYAGDKISAVYYNKA